MESAEGPLLVVTLLLAIISIVIETSKTGYVGILILPSSSKDKTKFKVNTNNVGVFTGLVAALLLVSSFTAWMLGNEIVSALFYGLINALFFGYGMAYLILLKKDIR